MARSSRSPEDHNHINYSVTLPYEGSNNHTVVIAPGYGGKVPTDKLANAFGDRGFDVYRLDHPHHSSSQRTAITLENVIQSSKDEGREGLSVVTHSAGTIDSSRALADIIDYMQTQGMNEEDILHELNVKNFTAIGPGGLKSDSKQDLLTRSFYELARPSTVGAIRKLGVSALAKALDYAYKSAWSGEIARISSADIRPHLHRIEDAGIPVEIVGLSRDRIFPSRHLGELALANGFAFTELDSDHIEPLYRPSVINQVVDLISDKTLPR